MSHATHRPNIHVYKTQVYAEKLHKNLLKYINLPFADTTHWVYRKKN